MQQSILLIEDEESLARFVELELQHEGYAVAKRFDGREGLDEALRADFTIGGYIFYATCEWLRRGKVYLLSTLPPDLVREMNIISSPDIGELLRQIDFTGKDVYVVPFGGYVMPLPPQEKEK